MSYRIDHDAVDRAADLLGIKLLVIVRRSTARYHNGCYHHVRLGAHRITVANNISAKAASDAIWHELGHALQHERYGNAMIMMDEYNRQLSAIGVEADKFWRRRTGPVMAYREIPMEQEANKIEQRYAGRIALAKRTR